MKATWRSLVIFVVFFVVGPTGGSPAWANGIDLPHRSGSPGEQVTLIGHDWLTCCPPNTPVEHVRLYMIIDETRLQLFDVAADTDGSITASFNVPDVPPGNYQLEACSDDPQGNRICLPEGEFTVLLPLTGAAGLLAILGTAIILTVTGLLIALQSPRATPVERPGT